MNKYKTLAITLLALIASLQFVSAIDPPTNPVARLDPASVHSLAFSPDGKLIVAGVSKRGQRAAVMAWDAATHQLRWVKPTTAGFRSMSFSPDGKTLAVADGRFSVIFLDPTTGKEVGELGRHPVPVNAVAFIPHLDILATASDNIIRLWDVKSGKIAKELNGHKIPVNSLLVSPNGRWLISMSFDATRIWDVATGTELNGVIEQNRAPYSGIVFVAPDRVAMAKGGPLKRIMELPSGKEVFTSRGYYFKTCYSPTAGLFAYNWLNSYECNIADLTFREPTAGEKVRIERLLKEFDADSYDVRVAASKAMRALGSVAEPMLRKAMIDGPSPEARARARETRRIILEEPILTLRGHSDAIGAMAFSPDGKVLATGGDDGNVMLWDPRSGKQLAQLEVSFR